jgi:hypothetical protein
VVALLERPGRRFARGAAASAPVSVEADAEQLDFPALTVAGRRG